MAFSILKNLKVILAASLGGFQYGYGVAVIAGAILFITGEFHLTPLTEGVLVSILLIGALIGSPLAGVFADKIGRRKTLALTAILVLVGSIWSSMASTEGSLLCARAVWGFAVGIIGIIAPLYLAEMAPAKERGVWVSCNQLAVTFGILAAYLCSYYWSGAQDWRSMFGFSAVPALLQLVFLHFSPETPAWEKKKEQKDVSWSTLFQPRYRTALFIGLALSMFQQITGINAVLYFAPRIFQDAGFSSASGAILATTGIGLINFLATIVSLWLIDRVGRKPLLLWGLCGMAFNLIVLAVSLFVESVLIDTIAIVTLMAYVAFFAIGMGPVPALMFSEIFPLQIRGRGMSLSSVSTWIFNFIVAFTFLDLTVAITPGGAFLLFALICILAILFTWKYIPETKGLELEEVSRKLSK